MPSKPDPYGIKLWVCCDVKTKYVWNLQVYYGKIGPNPERNQGKRVVLDLIDGLKQGRNITTDNFFTCYDLAQELLIKNFTLVGTMRKSRKEIPPVLMPSKQRDIYSSQYAFTNNTCFVSYVPKKNKAIILLSTMHNQIQNAEDETKKPEIILHYNQTKIGVDIMDQMVKHFTCRRATRRWTLSLFMNFLDIAALNSLIIWCQFNEEFSEKHDKRTLFLKQLIKQLIVPHVEKRSQNLSGIHFDVINDMRKIISPEFFVSASTSQLQSSQSQSSQSQSSQLDEPQIDPSIKSLIKRCFICKEEDRKQKSTRRFCQICKKGVCPDHSFVSKTFTCKNCQ